MTTPQGTSDLRETFETVRDVFENRIPFNKVLSLEIASLEPGKVALKFQHRDALVGNFLRGSLHGGVISAALDTIGGLVAFIDVLEKMGDASREERIARLGKIGTIDLRVDYLRAGLGKEYRAIGHVLRTGNKVAVTRMELLNDQEEQLAVGTGTYLVG